MPRRSSPNPLTRSTLPCQSGQGGKANLAKTALADMIKGMRPDQIAKFKDKLDG